MKLNLAQRTQRSQRNELCLGVLCALRAKALTETCKTQELFCQLLRNTERFIGRSMTAIKTSSELR